MFGAIVALIGIFGNILATVVWRERLKSRINTNKSKSTIILLITLAIGNCILLVDFSLYDSLPSLVPHIKESRLYAWCYAYVLNPLFYVSVVSSIWTMAAITVNRFLMVALPIKVASLFSATRSYLLVSMLTIFSILVSLPEFFIYQVSNDVEAAGSAGGLVDERISLRNDSFFDGIPSSSSIEGLVQRSPFGNSKVVLDYEFWLHCIVLVLTPWLVMAVLNFLIIVFLRRQWDFREKFQSKIFLKPFFSFMINRIVSF